METEVIGSKQPLEIGATGLIEIIQNVRIILTTMKTTVPLDRDFGVGGFVDHPLPVVQARMVAEIVAEVEKQEPRVRVTSVTWTADPVGAMDGRLLPVVRIKLRDGVEI